MGVISQEHVHVSACVYVRACAYACVHACPEISISVFLDCCPPHVLEIGFFTEPGAHQFQTEWWSASPRSSCLPFMPDHKYAWPCLIFHLISAVPISEPHACDVPY